MVNLDNHSRHAIRAAKNRNNWGRHAARLYCQKRGVPVTLYRIACQLETMYQLEARYE